MKTKYNPQDQVAIVGIGCMFAKSPDLKSFYHMLTHGVDGITEPPDTHQHLQDYYHPDPKKPDHIYCNRGGYLPATGFDPTEFSIPPNVVEATDTSQLLGLVTAKRALADAGYGDSGKAFDRSKASVILGVTGTQELVIPLGSRLGHPVWRRALSDAGVAQDQAEDIIERISDGFVDWQENSFPGLLGNVVAGRIANRLDFGGTNCVVDAACASSFGALHMALLELRSGRSDMVLAGGVDTINDAFMHMCFSKTQILSSTGDVRPFSDKADGTVLGEGIGMLVLKRLNDAEKDGDRIYAVIKGIGAASDGRSQSIYAPRAEGQAKALRQAYQDAGVDPTSVALVEAHGTGTRVGDQVEFNALCDVFGEQSPNGNRCALGSVKSNIGHTKAAAGTAGLIKAALSIYHKVLPPTLKADSPDPKLGVAQSPFYINTHLRPWLSAPEAKRRAGVSAFGFGGSNFHTVLEEYQPTKSEASWDGSIEIAAFSADGKNGLKEKLDAFVSEALDQPNFIKIGKLAKLSRKSFNRQSAQRLVMVLNLSDDFQTMAQTCEAARQQLNSDATAHHPCVFTGQDAPGGGLAFLFPGQGSQYTGMGREVVSNYPQSFEAVQEASAQFKADMPLGDFIYPRMRVDVKTVEKQLRQTQVAQPAIGAVSVAMHNALGSFGVTADATCGHSYGELVALHAAGWMSREDLWRLSVIRGRLMAEAGAAANETGTMMAVKAPLDEIETMIETLDEPVVLANRNSTVQGVLSGSRAGIEAAEKACADKGWRSIRLPVAAAFHSPLVADAQTPFGEALEQVQFSPCATPVMSNTLGMAYPEDPDEIRSILGRQLASPVDFISDINSLYDQGIRTFVEVGPKSVLTHLAKDCLKGKEIQAIAMDRSAGRNSGIEDLAATLAALAALGHEVDLTGWEKPLASQRKSRMAITLSGANYRSPQTRKPASKPAVAPAPKPSEPETANASVSSPKVNNPAPAPSPRLASHQPPVETARNNSPLPQPSRGHVDGTALSAVQHGLDAMQALQAQTTRAHEKFLETQAEASRTLQQMIQSVHQFSGAAPTVGQAPMMTASPSASLVPEQRPVEPAPVQSAPAAPIQPVASPENPAVEKAIIEIVSQLTGYPSEMLGLEMDIEADLGIDSIKRVEILSALEARMPHLPKVTPDMMGTLKTLGQICEFLCANETPAAGTPQQPAAPSPQQPANEAVSDALIAIVAELTGYPSEMLGLEMDIEADLGIDSIKRVEILSALEAQMPQLPKVTPDMMGTLKTLGQICEFLSANETPAAVAPQQTATSIPAVAETGGQEVSDALIAIVSELTGYPSEMLGLEMDIEADLGIDSIKRVEILSALEAQMPQLPKVTPDMMGTLKTLGQICEFLSANETPLGDASEPVAAATAPEAGTDAVSGALIAIVADLTGYPSEMLGLEMDIEADLGIDSIKRVEILSALEAQMPRLPKVTPDMMGTLKTLGQIIDFLEAPASDIQILSPTTHKERESSTVEPKGGDIARQVVALTELPPVQGTKPELSTLAPVAVVGASAELAEVVIAAMADTGIQARRFDSPDELTTLTSLDGLVLIAPIEAQEAFMWAQTCHPLLVKQAGGRKPFMVSISFLDGGFGFNGGAIQYPQQGALAGLTKTAAIEWPQVRCLALDIDPCWTDSQALARQVVTEILHAENHAELEIGLSADARMGLRLSERTISTGPTALDLSPQDVVVVTGGARGVTAAAALALADQGPGAMVLLGRSPEPTSEPEWLRHLTDAADIKRAILNNAFQDQTPSPKEVESIYGRVMANRQIAQTLDALKERNVNALYCSVDVRDADAVKETLEGVRQKFGAIRCLIHGAGVLEDRLIVDKQPEQFERVYATKVDGLDALLAATDKDEIRYLVLFSSVSARMGNQGQSDYAMANEVLNKTARQIAQEKSNCRVVSINWGPWDGGMVTPSLRRNFLNQGVSLIPVVAGAQAMVSEMISEDDAVIEVVIGGALPSASRHPEAVQVAAAASSSTLLQTCDQTVNIKRYPVLQSHKLNGRPVVPLALMTEWLAHSAMHDNPGLNLLGIDHLRLLKGIALDQGEKRVRMMAGKAERKGPHYEVPVEIRNGVQDGNEFVHSSARAILAEQLPAAPVFNTNGHLKADGTTPPLSDIYEQILFHGRDLHGIKEIIRIGADGMSARLASAPPPTDWVDAPLRRRWIADPLILDCAFQMAIIWCHEQLGQLSLPSFAASYRQYAQRFPKDGVTAVLEVKSRNDRKLISDFTFLNADQDVVAELKGYEAIMDPLLVKAFKAA